MKAPACDVAAERISVRVLSGVLSGLSGISGGCSSRRVSVVALFLEAVSELGAALLDDPAVDEDVNDSRA